jgi:HEPN domain-containing protein
VEEKEIDPDRIADFWLESAERDFDTMQNLMRSGDRSWALFLGHLVLEKLLKAHFVKRNRMHAIHSHDLLRLATKAGLELTADRVEWLDVVSTFNINARYDSYKHSFYRQCTTEFTVLWSGGIAELRTWLIKGL